MSSIRMFHGNWVLGAALWLALGLHGILEPRWGETILLFAALALMPIALSILCAAHAAGSFALWAKILQTLAAFLLVVAYRSSPGISAAGWALPWFLMTILIAISGLRRILKRRKFPIPDLCIDIGCMYLAIGGAWALMERGNIRPLHFDPTIVLLTAIHFHYAGFILPILAGLAAKQIGGGLSKAVCIAVIAAVPLVALGITASQLQAGPLIETIAAMAMASAGAGVAWLYLRLAWRSSKDSVARMLWGSAGMFLILGMTLAALYGLRPLVSIPWLNIPRMRAIHGSINAFGFSFLGLLGWVRVFYNETNKSA